MIMFTLRLSWPRDCVSVKVMTFLASFLVSALLLPVALALNLKCRSSMRLCSGTRTLSSVMSWEDAGIPWELSMWPLTWRRLTISVPYSCPSKMILPSCFTITPQLVLKFDISSAVWIMTPYYIRKFYMNWYRVNYNIKFYVFILIHYMICILI